MKLRSIYQLLNVPRFCLLAAAAIYLLIARSPTLQPANLEPAFSVAANHQVSEFANADDSGVIEFPIDWPPEAALQDKNANACMSGRSIVSTRKLEDESSPDASAALLQPYRQKATERWEKAISAFDELNQAESYPANSVLFIGSSSIRYWDTMATDMAPYSTIRRGYGGAKFTDMAVFADRIVTPHQYQALVMFIGNGVKGEPEDHTPDQIEELARYIVSVSRKHQPKAPVFLIEITPCENRFDVWPKIRAVNARLREVALSTPDTYFIPTASDYLKSAGTPRTELFVEDQLHLNEAGYDLWGRLIRHRLNQVLLTRAKDAAAEREPAKK